MSMCSKVIVWVGCPCVAWLWDGWDVPVYQAYMFNRVMEWVECPCVPNVHVEQGHGMCGMSLCTKCTCLAGSWNGWDVPVYQAYMFNRVMEWVGCPCVPSVHV